MIDPRFDRRFMAAALAVGRQGHGLTAPNPSVGAVLVREGPTGPIIVGAGRSANGGRPHAETAALAMAGPQAARGATCYVTLEPCSHHGKTPPCAEALIAAGIGGVVVAITDPNPEVAGRGIAGLQAAGIPVRLGVRAAEAARDLAGHITRMTHGRPHVTLKLAVSADGGIGRTGVAPGKGQIAISGPLSRTRVHLMRAEHDAIAVGIGTVLADDPELTSRLPGLAGHSPARIVFDTWARTPPDAALLHRGTSPVTIMVGEGADPARTAALSDAGAEIVTLPAAPGGVDLRAALSLLGRRGITTLLVEGGARLAEALVAGGLADEVVIVAGPARLGADAILPFGGDVAGGLAPSHIVRHRLLIGDDRWTYWERQCSPESSPTSDASNP